MLKKLTQRTLHILFLILRPLTIGVRGIFYDKSSGTVLLVKHTYSSDWALPGGGTSVGESFEAALERELKEEVGLVCENIKLFDTYYNRPVSKRDHVIIYKINTWRDAINHTNPKFEISRKQWYPISKLPENITPCTQHALRNFNLMINN
tara:strand:- start:396 stop:845 length:450 start_codon:yes stop_codon:yes gene_type:complete